MLRFTGLIYGNLTLIGGGPVVPGQTGNDEDFVGTLLEDWVRARLVPTKHVNQDGKWDEVQMIQRTSTHGVGKTDKSMFQQVDLPGVLYYCKPWLATSSVFNKHPLLTNV